MLSQLQATMLGRYNINVRDEVMKQLEDGPLAWKGLKKKMLQRCDVLQSMPVFNLRTRLTLSKDSAYHVLI